MHGDVTGFQHHGKRKPPLPAEMPSFAPRIGKKCRFAARPNCHDREMTIDTFQTGREDGRIMLDTIARFPDAAIKIETDGPPAYDSRRVIVTGDPDGFRWLAHVLLKMADDVDDKSKPARIGWHLVFGDDTATQLCISWTT